MADAPEQISPRDTSKTFSRATGAVHRFVLRRLSAHFLEVEDLHFNHDSSVLIADHRDTAAADDDAAPDAQADHTQGHVTALAVLVAAYRQIEAHPDQSILITGHADRSGADAYNLAISRRRAANVLHLLRGERTEWARLNAPAAHHEVEDYQQLLKWMFEEHGWETDPGEVDDVLGPETRGATQRFQARYNQEFSQSIAEDGTVGEETWKAFFDVYMRELQSLLDVDAAGLAARQQSVRLLAHAGGFVGCGENWPISGDHRSRTDRRVEIY